MRSRSGSKPIKYIEELFACEDALLRSVNNDLNRISRPIHLTPYEAGLLQFLIRLSKAKTVIEIGTLAGYSAIWIARALPDDGILYTVESNMEIAQAAQKNFSKCEVGDRIRLFCGDAIDELQNILHDIRDINLGSGKNSHKTIDAIFIDANKDGYLKYLDWAEKNLKRGGLIIADNTFLFGRVYSDESCGDKNGDNSQARPDNKSASKVEAKRRIGKSTISSMKKFNQRLADRKKYFATMIATDEGMTIAIKL